MSDGPLTQAEIDRTEAYWRAMLSSAVYALAEEVRRNASPRWIGDVVAMAISKAADMIGRMPAPEDER